MWIKKSEKKIWLGENIAPPLPIKVKWSVTRLKQKILLENI
jgi:hypothetical protein